MLELRGVSKRFGATRALATLDLSVAEGRTTALIGPSGCGKSTLLRMIVGLVRPDTGSVRVDGTLLDDDHLAGIRRRMGYVIQDGGLFPHLTARRNVTLMARHLGWDAARIGSRLDELVLLTHFPADALDRVPVELSGGQRQRVSLMRALMLDPDVLLLDEPLGALDPHVRFDLQEELRRIFRSLGKTVVLVTHDIAEAGYLGDSLVLLKDGRILQQGSLQELARQPADPFVARFLAARRTLELGP